MARGALDPAIALTSPGGGDSAVTCEQAARRRAVAAESVCLTPVLQAQARVSCASDKDVDVTVPTIRTRQPRGKASQEFHKRTDGSSDPGVRMRNLGPSEAESGVEFREANIALISCSLKGLGPSGVGWLLSLWGGWQKGPIL